VVDYSLVVGVPGRRAGWVCRCAARLPKAGSDGAVPCGECGNRYRDLGSRL